jgi:spermidine synthase
MDRLGLVEIAGTLVVGGLACAMLLSAVAPLPRRAKQFGICLAAGLAIVGPLALPVLTVDLHYHLMRSVVDLRPLVRVVETRSGVITVDQSGAVFGNGMYDGRFNTDLTQDVNGILRPYALSLFHPAPHDVLMIGLSSGSWAPIPPSRR